MTWKKEYDHLKHGGSLSYVSDSNSVIRIFKTSGGNKVLVFKGPAEKGYFGQKVIRTFRNLESAKQFAKRYMKKYSYG